MLSSRLNLIPPYIFNEIDKLKATIDNPVDFGIGDPDLPTPDFIIDELIKQAKNKENHRYPSYIGMRALREAIAEYTKKRFNIELDIDKEIIVLIGSKEGIAHLMQAIVNNDDEILIPEICYPVYRIQSQLWGGRIVEFPIHYENKFIPDINEIEKKINSKTKAIFLNYPNNPTGATVSKDFFDDIIKLADKYNLSIINDCVYSDVHHNHYPLPPSIIQSDKNKLHSIEFHSFSKTYNMTGWRIAYAIGNEKLINGLKKIKMNTDSGVFNAIQYAAIKALKYGNKHIEENNKIIKSRIDRLCNALEIAKFQFHKPNAAFYVFCKTNGIDSMELTKKLIKNYHIITTPGIGFGNNNYIRFSVTLPEEELKRGIQIIQKGLN